MAKWTPEPRKWNQDWMIVKRTENGMLVYKRKGQESGAQGFKSQESAQKKANELNRR